MIGTFDCTYETPCGWCTKWDKKCDRKIPERGKRAKCNTVDDFTKGLSSANSSEQTHMEESKLTEKEFIKKYCHNCGTQRCEGIGTEWFEGCHYKKYLKENANDNK